MDIDVKNIETLLAEKKYDEVRSLINEASSKEMTDTEKGAALVGVASIYLDISNAINANYRDALKEAVEGMKKINAAQSRSNDKVRIAEVKASLGK